MRVCVCVIRWWKVPTLGINNTYNYGVESLHGVNGACPFPGVGGRCFTNFPVSSASVAALNRTLWHAFGSAMSDESRWAYNNGYIGGVHMRGPQLNPQRDPRWGQCILQPATRSIF